MPDDSGYGHTFILYITSCFSTVTIVAKTRFIVTFYWYIACLVVSFTVKKNTGTQTLGYSPYFPNCVIHYLLTF